MDGGRHTKQDDGRRRALIVALIVGLIVVFEGVYLLTHGGNDAASPASATASSRPTHTRSPSPTDTAPPTPTGNATASPALPDGRSFVYA